MNVIEIIKILSDESRLRIYHILSNEHVCVCELESILKLNQANVSKHLSKMRLMGIVESSKQGQWIFYRISEDFLEKEHLLVAYLKEKMEAYPIMQRDYEALMNYKKSKFTCMDIKQQPELIKSVIHNGGKMKKVAFVCIHNSCRSQMAEGFGKALGKEVMEAYSAGTEDYPEVKPLAVQVMEEVGIDMSEHKPKLLSDIPQKLDILITMGCGVECPYVPCIHREDWGLEDPSGGPIDGFRNTRDIIKGKVEDLIERIKNDEL